MYEFLVFFFTVPPLSVINIVFMHKLYTLVLCSFTIAFSPPIVIFLVNRPIFMHITQIYHNVFVDIPYSRCYSKVIKGNDL